MIMQNNTTQFEDDQDEAHRIFTNILRAVGPYLHVFDCDDENHTARAMIETNGAAYTVVLAYDAVRQTFATVVCLRVNEDWTTPRLMILLRLQNHTAIRSSSINLDLENSILRVGSNVPLPAASVVRPIVRAAVRDTLRVLEDEDFRRFVN